MELPQLWEPIVLIVLSVDSTQQVQGPSVFQPWVSLPSGYRDILTSWTKIHILIRQSQSLVGPEWTAWRQARLPMK